MSRDSNPSAGGHEYAEEESSESSPTLEFGVCPTTAVLQMIMGQ